MRRSWLFGLRGTLTSTQRGSHGQSRGTGCTSIPGPKPRLGSCSHSRGRPAAPAGQDRSAWPGSLGAGGRRPPLFGASWAGRRPPRRPTRAAPLPVSPPGRLRASGGRWGLTGLALQLLRSETVKVYVNNEINILVSFFSEPIEVPYAFKMCFGLKNSFCEFGCELFLF